MLDKIKSLLLANTDIKNAVNFVKDGKNKISIWIDNKGNNDGEFTMEDIVIIKDKAINKIRREEEEEKREIPQNNKVLTAPRDEKQVFEDQYSGFSKIIHHEANDSITIVRTILPEIKNVEALCDKKTQELSFGFSRKTMEEHIINAADTPRFRNIREIQAKSPEVRTPEESALLEEFENLLDYVINAGMKYGVDPNLILSIIHQEVKFNGFSKKVLGDNGKGYMQITSAPIKDFLGFYKKNGQHGYTAKNKVNIYGKEMAELLESRGFNVNCETKDKDKLAKEIMAYLKQNNDPEFNILLGTLILRRTLVRAKGNPQKAARFYNGNTSATKSNPDKKECDVYASKVANYYRSLCIA